MIQNVNVYYQEVPQPHNCTLHTSPRYHEDKISKAATTRNQYNQVPHPTQDTTRETDKTQQNATHKRAKRLALSQ